MAAGLRAFPDTIRSIDSATFTGTYQKIGTPILYASPIVKFVNNSAALATISWDGTNDNDILPGNSFVLYDFCSDAGTKRGLYAAQGTQFWVKGAANTGLVYLVVFYSSEF
jgi:hypothetical protein